MIEAITLSANSKGEANNAFDQLLNEPVTLILVLGDSPNAQAAIQKLNFHINSDDVFYKGVRAVHVPKVSFIIDKLKSFETNPRLEPIQWQAIDSYLLMSLSNVFHNIGETVFSSKYNNRPKYYIERLIMMALAYDKDLSL